MMFRLPDEAALEAIKQRIGNVREVRRLDTPKPEKPAKSKPRRSREPSGPILSESAEQKLVIRWFDDHADEFGVNRAQLFAVPNGAFLAGGQGQRCAQMATLKATGLRVGVPDLFLSVMRGGYGGLYLEMKRVGGKSTEHQIAVQEMLRGAGYSVTECCGAQVAIAAIKEYLELFQSETE